MLTLFGAMLAGVLTESVMAKIASRDQEDEEDSGDEAEIGPASSAELLGTPLSEHFEGGDLLHSDDPSETGELPVPLTGSEADDLQYGDRQAEQNSTSAGDDLIDGRAGGEDLSGDLVDEAMWAETGEDPFEAGADVPLGQLGDAILAGDDGDDLPSGQEGDDPPSDVAGHHNLYAAFPEGDDGETDVLNVCDSDDLSLIGASGEGDPGADQFILKEWLSEGGIATISDYDAAEDQIVLVYDPDTHADPQLSLSAVAETEDVEILLDGEVIGRVTDGAGLSEKDILLLPA